MNGKILNLPQRSALRSVEGDPRKVPRGESSLRAFWQEEQPSQREGPLWNDGK